MRGDEVGPPSVIEGWGRGIHRQLWLTERAAAAFTGWLGRSRITLVRLALSMTLNVILFTQWGGPSIDALPPLFVIGGSIGGVVAASWWAVVTTPAALIAVMAWNFTAGDHSRIFLFLTPFYLGVLTLMFFVIKGWILVLSVAGGVAAAALLRHRLAPLARRPRQPRVVVATADSASMSWSASARSESCDWSPKPHAGPSREAEPAMPSAIEADPAIDTLDITVPIRPGMPLYPGDPPVRLARVAALAAGDEANVSRLDFGLHTGTHIDAPLHFFAGGAAIEQTPLDALIGPAWVAGATACDRHIDAAALARLAIPAGTRRLLLKTTNSRLWQQPGFSTDYIALTEDGAHAAVALGLRLIGIDYLSIAPFADPAPAHRALLGAGVVILEGLDLSRVAPGPYRLICLPLLVSGADGAPARAVLERA